MSIAPQRVLLINPTMTGKRNARFPLAVPSLRTALEGRHRATILDGNIDRNFITTAVRAVGEGVDAVGVTVMGGPQLTSAIAVSRAIRARCPTTRRFTGGWRAGRRGAALIWVRCLSRCSATSPIACGA